MGTQNVDFGGLAGGMRPPEEYPGVTAPDEATNTGDYEKNTKGIKKPTFLPIYIPPAVRLP